MSGITIGTPKSQGSPLQTWTRVALLVAFVLLSAATYYLDVRGVTLGRIAADTSVALFLCIIFASAAAFEFVALVILLFVRLRRGAAGDVKMLTSFTRVATFFAMFVVLLYLTGQLRAVGLAMGAFAGLLLGWSLQAPVSGMAAWVLVTLKRPFRVGDRVLFPSLGLSGDVLEVGLMYTKLDQVGGAVGSEEAIGRYILIPNAMLFSQVAINYTPRAHAAYFLDEVVIRLTYDSDWDEAERILLSVARDVTSEIIRETGREPYIRSDIYDYGVYMRLRYMTLATDRPRVSHEITRRIFRDVQRNPRVDFAIPFIYSYRRGVELGGRSTGGPLQPDEVPIESIHDPEAGETLSDEDERGVVELAERIEKMGLLQPVVVRPGDVGGWELVAGRFRLIACKQLGWKVIPVLVKRGLSEDTEAD